MSQLPGNNSDEKWFLEQKDQPTWRWMQEIKDIFGIRISEMGIGETWRGFQWAMLREPYESD